MPSAPVLKHTCCSRAIHSVCPLPLCRYEATLIDVKTYADSVQVPYVAHHTFNSAPLFFKLAQNLDLRYVCFPPRTFGAGGTNQTHVSNPVKRRFLYLSVSSSSSSIW